MLRAMVLDTTFREKASYTLLFLCTNPFVITPPYQLASLLHSTAKSFGLLSEGWILGALISQIRYNERNLFHAFASD